MSTETVAVVEQIIESINSADKARLADLLATNVEFRDLRRAPDTPEVVTGRDAVVSVLSVWIDAFDDFRAEVDEYIDDGAWVLCPTTWRGRGKGSDVEIELRATGAYLCRHGQAVSAIFGYESPESARREVQKLEAAS